MDIKKAVTRWYKESERCKGRADSNSNQCKYGGVCSIADNGGDIKVGNATYRIKQGHVIQLDENYC